MNQPEQTVRGTQTRYLGGQFGWPVEDTLALAMQLSHKENV